MQDLIVNLAVIVAAIAVVTFLRLAWAGGTYVPWDKRP